MSYHERQKQKQKKQKTKKPTEMQCDPTLVPVPGKKEKGGKNLIKEMLLGHWQNFNKVYLLGNSIVINAKCPEFDHCTV